MQSATYKTTHSGMLAWGDEANEKLKQFVLYLKRNAKPYAGKKRTHELSVNSIPQYFYSIVSFFDYYDVPIRTKKLAKMFPEQVESDLRPMRREEIQKLLQLAKPRDRALILTPVACGAREGGLSEFEVRNVRLVNTEDWTLKPLVDCIADKKVVMPVGSIGMISVYGSSKKAKYISFVTYEDLLAIGEYLEYRMLHHEKITGVSPLFRDYFVPLGRNVNHAKKISSHRINRIVATLMDRAGVPRDELQPLHGLRKFFNTACKNAGVDYMFKETFMGHSINLDRIYYDPESPESLQKMVLEYTKAIDALTFSEENRLKRQNVILKEQVDDISTLKARVAKQEENTHKIIHELGDLLVKTILKNENEERGTDPGYIEVMSKLVKFTRKLQDENYTKEPES